MSDFKYAINEQIQIAGACNGTVIRRLSRPFCNRYKIDAEIDKYSGWYSESDLMPGDLQTEESIELAVTKKEPVIKTIAENWEFFEKTVLSDDATTIQRRNLKYAFYAGALAAHDIYHDIAKCAPSKEEGVAMIKNLRDELIMFYNQM